MMGERGLILAQFIAFDFIFGHSTVYWLVTLNERELTLCVKFAVIEKSHKKRRK